MTRSALVKIGTGMNKVRYMGVKTEDLDKVSIVRNYMSMRVHGKAVLLTGEQAGTEVTEATGKQAILISPSIQLNPSNYTILLSYNPDLLNYGQISAPSIINPFQPENIKLRLDLNKKVDLTKLDYIFELYMID